MAKLQPAQRVRDSTNGSFAIIKDDLCGSGVDVNSGPAQQAIPPQTDLYLGRTRLGVISYKGQCMTLRSHTQFRRRLACARRG